MKFGGERSMLGNIVLIFRVGSFYIFMEEMKYIALNNMGWSF